MIYPSADHMPPDSMGIPADYLVAPCCRRISITSACPRRSAQARGVAHGSSSGTLVGAPRASNNSTMSGMLVRAAHASGVEPYSSSLAEIDARVQQDGRTR
jgi:hypothetical protein